MLLALALSAAAPATLDQFEQTLAAQDSATAALLQWCGERHLAKRPEIHAEVVDRTYRGTIPADLILAMGPEGDHAQGYRHVRLRCGRKVLSEAYLWFIPDKLTPEMDRTLDNTDTPFGRVVAPLHFRRERLKATRAATGSCPTWTILSHTAVLRLPDGSSLAYVIECYTRANLRGR